MVAHTAPAAPRGWSKPKAARAPKRPLNHYPEAVRQAREARGLTQAALAEKIGRTGSYVSEIEIGTRDARPELLQAIAEALGVSITRLERRRAKVKCPVCDTVIDTPTTVLVPLHLRADGTFCEPEQAAA